MGTGSRNKLLSRCSHLCAVLDDDYRRILDTLAEMDTHLATMTAQLDAGLRSVGYSVDEILALGGPPRSARSVYRRQGGPRRLRSPGPMEEKFVEAGYTSLVPLIETGVRHHAAWLAEIQSRSARLEQCRSDLSRSLAVTITISS